MSESLFREKRDAVQRKVSERDLTERGGKYKVAERNKYRRNSPFVTRQTTDATYENVVWKREEKVEGEICSERASKEVRAVYFTEWSKDVYDIVPGKVAGWFYFRDPLSLSTLRTFFPYSRVRPFAACFPQMA